MASLHVQMQMWISLVILGLANGDHDGMQDFGDVHAGARSTCCTSGTPVIGVVRAQRRRRRSSSDLTRVSVSGKVRFTVAMDFEHT